MDKLTEWARAIALDSLRETGAVVIATGEEVYIGAHHRRYAAPVNAPDFGLQMRGFSGYVDVKGKRRWVRDPESHNLATGIDVAHLNHYRAFAELTGADVGVIFVQVSGIVHGNSGEPGYAGVYLASLDAFDRGYGGNGSYGKPMANVLFDDLEPLYRCARFDIERHKYYPQIPQQELFC